MVVHRTTAVIIFGSPTKFLVVLGLPDYHYFDPCTYCTKETTQHQKWGGGRKGGGGGEEHSPLCWLFTKHPLQLRDPTQRMTLVKLRGQPCKFTMHCLVYYGPLLGIRITQCCLTYINKQINFTSHWINTILTDL